MPVPLLPLGYPAVRPAPPAGRRSPPPSADSLAAARARARSSSAPAPAPPAAVLPTPCVWPPLRHGGRLPLHAVELPLPRVPWHPGNPAAAPTGLEAPVQALPPGSFARRGGRRTIRPAVELLHHRAPAPDPPPPAALSRAQAREQQHHRQLCRWGGRWSCAWLIVVVARAVVLLSLFPLSLIQRQKIAASDRKNFSG